MDKRRAISIIEGLYPPDSHFPDTAKIGKELLQEAKDYFSNWRNEPEEILCYFAGLCIEEEKKNV